MYVYTNSTAAACVINHNTFCFACGNSLFHSVYEYSNLLYSLAEHKILVAAGTLEMRISPDSVRHIHTKAMPVSASAFV